MHKMLYALLPCLLLAACGGGDGGDGGGVQQTASPVLGSRSVPGGDVTLKRTTGDGFQIATGVADVAKLEVLSGSDYATASPIALTAGPHGWDGAAAHGAPLLVRMTLADGSVLETAPGDFAAP